MNKYKPLTHLYIRYNPPMPIKIFDHVIIVNNITGVRHSLEGIFDDAN